VHCGGLYEGAEVLGRVAGLSATGVTFATTKPLRTADRLQAHGRFFSEEVRATVRAVDRILDHGHRAEAPISYCPLRLLTEPKAEPRRGMRRLLR
jgi:hypothetical protein